jgi:hypothetical protein
VHAPLPSQDPLSRSSPARFAHRGRRSELCLAVALLVICAILLETAADILPSKPLVGTITPGRGFLLLALVALVAAGGRVSDFRTSLDPPIILLVIATAVSTYHHTTGAPLRFLLTSVGLYYVTVGLVRLTPGAKAAIPLVALVAVAIPAAVGVSQLAQHVPTTFYRRGLFEPVDSPRPLPGLQIRAIGTFTNPNLLAAYLLLLSPFAVLAAVAARRRAEQVVLGGLAALAYAGLLITFSRAAVVGLLASAVAAVLVILARRQRWRNISRAGWPALGITASALLVAGMTGLLGRVSGRSQAFTLATRALRGHVLTGVGPDRAGAVMNALGHSGPPYYHAHNLWLTWLVETGVVGFAAIALITLSGLIVAARTAVAGYPLGVAGLAALVGFCTVSLVDDPANAERVATTFWFALALITADAQPSRLKPRAVGSTADMRDLHPRDEGDSDGAGTLSVRHGATVDHRDDQSPTIPDTRPSGRSQSNGGRHRQDEHR